MDNKIIHQALAELEDNLSNLESARSQVVNVSRASRDLTVALTKILKQLENLDLTDLFDKDQFKKKVDESYAKFNTEVKATSKDFAKSYQELSGGFKDELVLFDKKINSTVKKLGTFEKELKEAEGKISTFDLNSFLNQMVEDFNKKIEKSGLSHSQDLKSIKDNVNTGFKNTERKIDIINYKKTLDTINDRILSNSESIKKVEKNLDDGIEQLQTDFKDQVYKLTSTISGLKSNLFYMNVGSIVLLMILLGVLILR